MFRPHLGRFRIKHIYFTSSITNSNSKFSNEQMTHQKVTFKTEFALKLDNKARKTTPALRQCFKTS